MNLGKIKTPRNQIPISISKRTGYIYGVTFLQTYIDFCHDLFEGAIGVEKSVFVFNKYRSERQISCLSHGTLAKMKKEHFNFPVNLKGS